MTWLISTSVLSNYISYAHNIKSNAFENLISIRRLFLYCMLHYNNIISIIQPNQSGARYTQPAILSVYNNVINKHFYEYIIHSSVIHDMSGQQLKSSLGTYVLMTNKKKYI